MIEMKFLIKTVGKDHSRKEPNRRRTTRRFKFRELLSKGETEEENIGTLNKDDH